MPGVECTWSRPLYSHCQKWPGCMYYTRVLGRAVTLAALFLYLRCELAKEDSAMRSKAGYAAARSEASTRALAP